jgi:hypothetical protein
LKSIDFVLCKTKICENAFNFIKNENKYTRKYKYETIYTKFTSIIGKDFINIFDNNDPTYIKNLIDPNLFTHLAGSSFYKNTSDSATYVLEYFKEKSPKTDSLKVYPLKKISEIEYWSFQKNTGADPINSKEVLTLSRRENSLTGLVQQPVIANFSDIEKKWICIPQTINGLSQYSLSGISTSLKNGCITFGELVTQALPFDKRTVFSNQTGNFIYFV